MAILTGESINYKEAFVCYEKTTGKDDDWWINKGDLFFKIKLYKFAFCCYNKIKIQNNTQYDHWWWKKKSDNFYEVRAYDESLKCYKKVIELLPNNPKELNNIGNLCYKIFNDTNKIDYGTTALAFYKDAISRCVNDKLGQEKGSKFFNYLLSGEWDNKDALKKLSKTLNDPSWDNELTSILQEIVDTNKKLTISEAPDYLLKIKNDKLRIVYNSLAKKENIIYLAVFSIIMGYTYGYRSRYFELPATITIAFLSIFFLKKILAIPDSISSSANEIRNSLQEGIESISYSTSTLINNASTSTTRATDSIINNVNQVERTITGNASTTFNTINANTTRLTDSGTELLRRIPCALL